MCQVQSYQILWEKGELSLLAFFLFVHSRNSQTNHIFVQCQKEAWNCATLPHKPLCAKIHYVKESIGPDNWSLLWTPDVTYAQFQDMCKANKVDTKILQDIPLMLASLASAKSTLRDSEIGGLQMNEFGLGSEHVNLVQMLNTLKDRTG